MCLCATQQYLDKRLFVQLNGSRKVIGVLRGYDVRPSSSSSTPSISVPPLARRLRFRHQKNENKRYKGCGLWLIADGSVSCITGLPKHRPRRGGRGEERRGEGSDRDGGVFFSLSISLPLSLSLSLHTYTHSYITPLYPLRTYLPTYLHATDRHTYTPVAEKRRISS